MKIAIVGYGKMGHMIESFAKKRGNSVVITCDPYAEDATFKSSDSEAIAKAIKESGAEGIIEFTHPDSVENNIKALLPLGIPLVVGTTGWLSKLDSVTSLTKEANSNLFCQKETACRLLGGARVLLAIGTLTS